MFNKAITMINYSTEDFPQDFFRGNLESYYNNQKFFHTINLLSKQKYHLAHPLYREDLLKQAGNTAIEFSNNASTLAKLNPEQDIKYMQAQYNLVERALELGIENEIVQMNLLTKQFQAAKHLIKKRKFKREYMNKVADSVILRYSYLRKGQRTKFEETFSQAMKYHTPI